MGLWDEKPRRNGVSQFDRVDSIIQLKNFETQGKYQDSLSGHIGELSTSSVLKTLPNNYTVMDNILIQTGIEMRPYHPEKYGQSVWKVVNRRGKAYEVVKKSAQIEHIVVSEYGIFVIETKNHKGTVFGGMNGRVWTQVLGGNSHYTFYNPVHQNLGHISALSKAIGLSPAYMTGLIVFTNPEAKLGSVNCDCCCTLDCLYDTIVSYNKPLFSLEQYLAIIQKIDSINSAGYSLSKEHELYVQDLQHRHDINKLLTSVR